MVIKGFEKKGAAAEAVPEVKKPLMEKKASSETGGLDSGAAAARKTCKWCEKGSCWKNNCETKQATQICRFFAKSDCSKGEACPYRHDLEAEDIDNIDYCVFFAKGDCRKGDKCTFNHDYDPEDAEVKKVMKEKHIERATAWSEGGKGKGKGKDKGKGKWGYDDGAAQALGAILALALGGMGGGGWEEESWEEPAQQQVKGGKFGGDKGVGKSGGLKTRLCNNFVQGFCPRGDSCTFAHGEQELGSSQTSGGMGGGMGGGLTVAGLGAMSAAKGFGKSNMPFQQGGGLVAGRLSTMGAAKGGGKGAGRLNAALAAGGACKWCQQGQCWTHGVTR